MSTPQVVLSYDFSDLAEEYRQAYYALPERTPISWPRYFLFCHSIELLLKAYLARIGLTENQLQAFGHNIKNLLEEAIKCGLSLSGQCPSSHRAAHGCAHQALAALPDDNVRP